jgi:hypothetical protein
MVNFRYCAVVTSHWMGEHLDADYKVCILDIYALLFFLCPSLLIKHQGHRAYHTLWYSLPDPDSLIF